MHQIIQSQAELDLFCQIVGDEINLDHACNKHVKSLTKFLGRLFAHRFDELGLREWPNGAFTSHEGCITTDASMNYSHNIGLILDDGRWKTINNVLDIANHFWNKTMAKIQCLEHIMHENHGHIVVYSHVYHYPRIIRMSASPSVRVHVYDPQIPCPFTLGEPDSSAEEIAKRPVRPAAT